MKTQIKRISKSSLAVVLTLCLLFSCLTVGIVATDAAKMNSESTGGFNINGKIYFKKPSGWTNVRMSIGGDKNNKWREMIAPAGNIDDIYYFNVNWSNADGFFFTDVDWSCVAEKGAYWDWFAQNTTNRTGYSNSATAGNLYISTGNADSNAPSSETYTNITVSAKAYVKNGSSFTEADSTIATASVTGKNKDNSTSNSSIAKYTKSTFTTTKVNNSYTFLGWYNSSNQAISGATNTTYTINSTESAQNLRAVYELSSVTYNNIAVAAKGSTDGSTYNTTLSGTPATISANSYTTGSSALNISAGTVSGYSFYKWVVTAGSGTIGSATTANTTFTPSKSNTTVTAQYKKNYTISKNTPTNGSVALNKTSAVAGDSYTVTLTPNDGYKVKSLTLNGSAVTVSNNKYTGTASGTSDTLAFVATFEANTAMKLYIAGRFHVKDSSGNWVNTFDSGDWNATSTKIPFTYLSGTTYKVDTNATLAELSGKISGFDPVFFVYDTTETTAKNWYASSATTMSTSGTTLVSSGGANSNLKFSSTSTDGPVTIYYDSNTHKIWYTIPDFYNVTVNTATGGSVTASPSRAEAGAEITLTVTPTNGYKLKSLTAKDSNNATVTITNNKFTMPAKNVTVTPVFEIITWSGLTAVGKYSTTAANDASYSNAMSPNPVTIAATSATQLDGVAVSAPGTDPTGYVFAGWYTAKGSFANAANKDTTFYPNAENAVAIAKYKKIFNITSSVDNTGTGAGTVSVSITSGAVSGQTNKILAGGSYKITATAKSGSAIESIKVNNGAGTTTSPRTVNSVSADQNVVVKFAAKPHVIGALAAAGWTEPGDAMKSNAGGTEFTFTRTELAAGTYDFQHYIGTGTGGTYDSASTDIASKTISGGATLSAVDNGYGGKKLQLELTAKSDVTLVSDGSKFTAITVRRSGGQKFNVTFKKADNTTITGTYLGTPFTTASADAVVQVYEGDEISFTVTAASGYHISALTSGTTPAFSPAVTKEYKLSNVTAAKTITPTAAADVNVTAKTNKSARGTVSVDKNKSFKGDTVKITVTPLAGSLKSLTATYANGKTYEYKNSEWTEVTQSTGANKISGATGAAIKSASTGAAQTIDMVMKEDSAVTINAVFDPYSAESTWYYNGYNTSGNAVSGYHGKQMTEAMVGGEKFSYYQVVGRTGTDQLMTVSNGAASSGTRYVYFTASAEGGWSTDENHQYAYFYNNSGNAGNAWPGYKMTKYTTNDYGQNVYRVEIPTSSSPTGVVFNNASNSPHKTTNVTDLTKGGYYLLSTHYNDNGTEVHDWQSYDCTYPGAGYSTGTEYFYGSDSDASTIYSTDSNGKSIFNTTGFYRHGANSKNYAKPRLTASDTGDYYVNVLYPGKTYTINGVTKTIGSDPVVIWSTEPLAGDDENVKIYAKDGSIRGETFGSTYANIADTKIYLNNTVVGTNHAGSITNQTYQTYKAAKGDTLVIQTQIGATDTGNLSNAAALKAKYYVRGFCINGEVTQLLEPNDSGLYTLTYKVPEDYEGKNIEITPIYYLKDTEAYPVVTYRVTGFTDELKAIGAGKPGWGDTLYTYPFYGKLGGQNNAFGAYPGQPMVYYKGQYQMQIPTKSTAWDPYGETAATVNNTNVAGVTMSNGYWDSVHKQIMGYGDNSTSADHVQTYDYGDFYKIFNEKAPVDNIVFDFKYRTKKHNFENQPAASVTKSTLDTNYGTNGNGFELLTNFHGRNVDLFGTALSGDAADPSKTTPVYVVSIGGVNGSAGVENVAGYYATEWMVYGSSDGSNYTRISGGGKNSIPPEVLVLNNNSTSFNTTTYPSAVNTTAKPYKITDWQALYTALEDYRGKPVMISYEAADAQQGQEMYYTGTGGATRNDGRWLYSKNGENITSNIKIQYSDDNGANYTDLNTTTPQVSGLSAYFTNDGVEGQMTYSTTIDPDKTFDFEAKTTNGNYKFVGWYMEDGTKITTDNASHTERSGSYTFVAKFMQVQSGQLILSHSADKGTIGGTDYQGSGTAKIGVVVKNGDEVVRTFDLSTSDVTLDDKIIKSDSTYTIEVTLEATAIGNDDLGTTVLANPTGQDATYFNAASTTTEGKTKTIVLNSFTVASLFSGTTQNVKNIIYHSYFTAVTFHYDLLFEYTDRFGTTKQFYRQGYLTAAQAANKNYVNVEYDEQSHRNERRLMPAFIQTIAPHVSNFGETINWTIRSNGYAFNVQNHVYTLNETILSGQTKNDKRDVTFVLPYEHTDGIARLNNGVGTAATTTNFELTGDNAVTYNTIPVLLNNGENGIYSSADKKNWIAAPAVINENGKQKFFQYWSIKTTEHSEENDPEVARCYFNGFNYVAYDNYIITAVYDEVKTSIAESGVYTGATYLETSRNQWNTKANSDKNAKDASGNRIAADLLYNDFVLNYNYKGVDIYKGASDSANVKELGIVVERIDELDIKQDGTKDTDVSKYVNKYKTGLEANKGIIEDVINGSNTEKKFTKHAIEKTSLDNKNRIEVYDAIYNGAGWDLDKQASAAKYTYKNYVYRVYSYMKYTDDNGETQIALAQVPAYFTMYDEAVAGYTAPTSTNS